jgi:hypothetical protein
MIDNNNEDKLDQLPSFKPDLNIVYPNKKKLYRREAVRPFFSINRLVAAAALMLTAGIIWWLSAEQDPQKQVAAVGSNPTNHADEINTIPKIQQDTVVLKSSVAKKNALTRKVTQENPIVVANPESLASNNTQEIPPYQEVVQQEIVGIQAEQPKSNFSEEALQAAAEAVVKDVAVKPRSLEEKSENYIPLANERGRKKPFRGLIRALSRTILGEGESLGDENIIRVANFKIPVSN